MFNEEDKPVEQVEIIHPPPPLVIDEDKESHIKTLRHADESIEQAQTALAIARERLASAIEQYEERKRDPRT